MTLLTPLASRHLSFLGLVAAIFVVFIHATTINYSSVLGSDSVIGRVEAYLSYHLLHVAVAYFFFSAAFFLFAGLDRVSELRDRIGKRLVTLLMPYCAWSALWLVLVMTANAYLGYQLSEVKHSFFWHLFIEPLPGQLWFLRDLMMLVLLAPLFYRLPFYLLLTLGCVFLGWWAYTQTPVVLSLRVNWFHIISNEALTWFTLGCIAARKSKTFALYVDKGVGFPVMALLLAGWMFGPYIDLPGQAAHGMAIVSGLIFLLSSSRLFAYIASRPLVAYLSAYSFLIYVGHHPLLLFLKTAALSIHPDSQVWHTIIYVLLPTLVIVFIVLIFSFIARFMPSLVLIANGGRRLPSFARFKGN